MLNHYRRTGGWQGYRWYVLCVLEDRGTTKYGPGGLALETVIPAAKLAAFRQARSTDPNERRWGKGEPDLFLYKDDRSVLFLETKMGDPIDSAQLRCLAQIRTILECDAEIVRIVPQGKAVRTRSYSISIDLPSPAAARAPTRRQRK